MPESADDKSRIADLEADNRRLRRLLDERDAPGELRHRLRSTVAIMRTIIRRTAETERDLDSYVGHVEDRLDALVRAQSAADERGTISLHFMLADELQHYGCAEGERAVLSGPDIEFEPRAGQVFAMAIHELVINAVEHGEVEGDGRIRISWAVSDATDPPMLQFEWKESGSAPAPAKKKDGFGTEVLNQALAYELNARTSMAFEQDGLRCEISFPLTDRIGVVSDR